jgi:hypothetical protein
MRSTASARLSWVSTLPPCIVFTWVVFALTVTLLLLRNVGPLPLVLGGGFIGFLRKSTPWERVTGFVPTLTR